MSRRSARRAREAREREAVRAAIASAVSAQPDQGSVFGEAPRSALRPVDEAAKNDPQNIVSILREADVGLTRRLIDLGKSARKKDSRLDGVAAMRVTVIKSRRWVLKPAVGLENDAAHLEHVAIVSRMLGEKRVAFAENREHLAHGVLEPQAVLEHNWYRSSTGFWNTAPSWRHPRRFVWNDKGQLCKCDLGVDSAQGVPLTNFPAKFVVHTPVAGRSDYPWMRGALRSRLLGSLAKRKGVGWWLSAIERYGQPQVFATLDDGDSNLVDRVLKALRSIGPDWRAILPSGVDLKPIPGQVSESLHKSFVDWQNTEDAVLILGQNLSTEVKGGSYAAAASQERVRADILGSDLTALDETTDDQWIAPIWQYNWPGEPSGHIETQLSTATPWTLADYQAGVCTRDEYAADNGHDPEPEGRGKRYFIPPPTFATPGMPAGGAAAASPFPRAQNGTPTSSTSQAPIHPLRRVLLPQ
jgi:phage gp29-like protein